MPQTLGTRAWKAMDYVLCKTASATFNAIQVFNKYNPNPNFTPKWSDKPLLKSWEKSKPTLGWPRPQVRKRSARSHHRRQKGLARPDA